MNKSNLPQKIIVSVLTVIICCGIYALGVYTASRGFSSGITTDVLLVVFCVYYSLSVCVLLRKKPLKTPGIPIKKLMRICSASAVIIYLFLAVSVFFAGTAFGKGETVLTVFVVFCTYSLCRMTYVATIRLEPSSDAISIDRDTYPEIYSIAKRAAEAVGYGDRDIQINVTERVAVSTIDIEGVLRILIGTQLVSLVTEYELEALITAEIGLVRAGSLSNNAVVNKKYTYWHLAVADSPSQIPNFLLAVQYRLIESRLISELESAALTDESARTQAAVCFGIPSDYLNAIAKMTLFGLYMKSPPKKGYFDGTEPPRDMEERFLRGYIGFRDKYGKSLDTVIRDTTAAGFDTPLSEKISELSESGSYDLFTEPISRAYIAETENLLRTGNGLMSEILSEGYAEAREANYLPAKEITDRYESQLSDGNKPDIFDTLNAAEAYMTEGDTDRAEELYDLILSENPSEPCACLEKGAILLLDRYDAAGIQYLDKAIEGNCFSAGKVFRILSEYYGIIGNKKLSECYSAKAACYNVSEEKRKDGIFSVGKPEDFVPVSPDPEALREICARLKELSDGGAEKIFIAAREFDGEIYNVVFVKLRDEVPNEKKFAIMHEIYLYLDSRDENFYLTEYSEVSGVFEIAEKSENTVNVPLE